MAEELRTYLQERMETAQKWTQEVQQNLQNLKNCTEQLETSVSAWTRMEEHFRDRGENILGKIVQKEKDYEAEREQIGKVLEALDKRGNQPGGNEQESTDPEATKKPKLDLNLEPEWEPTYLAEAEQIYGRLKLVLLKHAFAPVVADAQRRLLSSPTTSLNQNHAEKTRKIVRNIIKDLADKKEDLPANLEELANSKKAEIEQRILEAHQP